MWFTDGVTANSNTLQWVELIGIPTFEATSTVSAHITSMQNPLWRNKKKDIWKTCSKSYMQEIPCHALIKKVKYKWWMVRSLWTREKCYTTRFKWHLWRKPGFSLPDAPAIVYFKVSSRVGKQCFSSTTAKGVHTLVAAMPNCNSFTVTSTQYLESFFFF